jgi:CheY-like chemotaxis protein
MKEIVQWLLGIEDVAGAFYKEASELFGVDSKISDFFSHLSHEEARHFKVMEEALEHLEHHVATPSDIIVDSEMRSKIESAFAKGRELIASGKANKEDLLHCLAVTEFSEWNDIFVYVVNTLRKERRFMFVAANMHHHVKQIEHFLESLPEGRSYLPILKNLPPLWKEQILVIDDSPPTADLLSKVLSKLGRVETAENGKAGLKKVTDKYFDAIISDVHIPVMDGIEFYKSASGHDPQIAQRILFYSAELDQDNTDFFRANNLRYLKKPASISELLKRVSEIMPEANTVFERRNSRHGILQKSASIFRETAGSP